MKIQTLETLASLLDNFRRIGSRIVLAHGCFDILHIGHLRHLKAASQMGNVLVVTITADAYVNKGDSRPVFPQDLRAECVAELTCVDYVAINHAATAVEAIKRLRPQVLIKGPECRLHPTHELFLESQAVQATGGQIAYTDGELFSSTELLRRVLSYYA